MNVLCKTDSNFTPQPQSHTGYRSIKPTAVCFSGRFGKILLTERCLLIAQGSKVGIYAFGSSTSSNKEAVFGVLCPVREATNKVLAKTKLPSRMSPTDKVKHTQSSISDAVIREIQPAVTSIVFYKYYIYIHTEIMKKCMYT